MIADEWEFFEKKIATLFFEDSVSFNEAIGKTCRKYPNAKSDNLLLAAISFVTHFDNFSYFAEEESLAKSHIRYRIIASLAADIALLNPEGRLCSDLVAFWKATSGKIFN
jgi:hypothetical protein